uniref:ATP synthase subunit a n=1 Tax=Bolivaritettix sikkinensis TaxID=2035526 RepID=A0A6G6BJ62_9ORTH|nr:ATP synthase F0 subunit 6 [Bolivaritettix sikkinensis]
MMTNLFSSFDPSTNWQIHLNWMSTMTFIMIIPPMFWLIKSRSNTIFNLMIYLLNKELTIILNNMNKSSTLMFIGIFMMILINNMMGLFPYIFTSTSHLIMTLSIALPTWISLNLFGWMNKPTHMLEHMVPQGTPSILMPFMVCIESISNIIRPATLAIRLAANMIAGHLLLTLLGNSGNQLTEIMMLMLLTTQILLFMLESAVSMIQAYVFSVLSTLYSSEIN